MNICEKFIEFEDELKSDLFQVSKNKELVSDSYQDAYIKIQNYVDNGREFYGDEKSIKSLFKFTCRNVLIDIIRKENRRNIIYADKSYGFIDYDTPDDKLIEMEELAKTPEVNKKLKKAFSNMTNDIYMTYILRRKGIKFKDIAYLMDTSISTALGRMRYAKSRIKEEFKLT